MKKNLVIIFAALALMTTACGSNASYRGVKKADAPAPSDINEPADPSLEEKAAVLVDEDINNKFTNTTLLADILAKEIRGVSVKVVNGQKDDGRPTLKSHIEMEYYSLASDQCVATKRSSDPVNTSDLTKFNNIKGGGRFRCLEASCVNGLLFIEESRAVQMLQEDGRTKTEVQTGSLAVLMKIGTDGIFKPVTTELKVFTQLFDVKMGELNCIDEVTQNIYDQQAQAKQNETNAKNAILLRQADQAAADKAAKAGVVNNAANQNAKDAILLRQADQAAKDKAAADAKVKAQLEALKAQGGTLHTKGR